MALQNGLTHGWFASQFPLFSWSFMHLYAFHGCLARHPNSEPYKNPYWSISYITHGIHVGNIHLHLADFHGIHVGKYIYIHNLVGGWTNPSEKYARQIGFIFPNFRGENKKYLSCHHLAIHGSYVQWTSSPSTMDILPLNVMLFHVIPPFPPLAPRPKNCTPRSAGSASVGGFFGGIGRGGWFLL